jgi:hypothetical protein
MPQDVIHFEFDVEGRSPQRWSWRCLQRDTGSVLKLSHATFETLYACVKDAEKHGYVSPHGMRD